MAFDWFQFSMLCFQIVLVGLFVVLLRAVKFDPTDIPEELFARFQADNRGVASGTARQKKVIDELFGEALLDQNPLIAQLCNWKPEIGDALKKWPNMVPYVATLANSLFGMAVNKLPVPDELKPLLAQFMAQMGGQQPGTQAPQAPGQSKVKMPWE